MPSEPRAVLPQSLQEEGDESSKTKSTLHIVKQQLLGGLSFASAAISHSLSFANSGEPSPVNYASTQPTPTAHSTAAPKNNKSRKLINLLSHKVGSDSRRLGYVTNSARGLKSSEMSKSSCQLKQLMSSVTTKRLNELTKTGTVGNSSILGQVCKAKRSNILDPGDRISCPSLTYVPVQKIKRVGTQSRSGSIRRKSSMRRQSPSKMQQALVGKRYPVRTGFNYQKLRSPVYLIGKPLAKVRSAASSPISHESAFASTSRGVLLTQNY